MNIARSFVKILQAGACVFRALDGVGQAKPGPRPVQNDPHAVRYGQENIVGAGGSRRGRPTVKVVLVDGHEARARRVHTSRVEAGNLGDPTRLERTPAGRDHIIGRAVAAIVTAMFPLATCSRSVVVGVNTAGGATGARVFNATGGVTTVNAATTTGAGAGAGAGKCTHIVPVTAISTATGTTINTGTVPRTGVCTRNGAAARTGGDSRGGEGHRGGASTALVLKGG